MRAIYLLLLLLPMTLIGQENFTNDFIFLGNGKLSNFRAVLSNNTEQNKIISLKTGEELTGYDSDDPSFVIAKDYEFIVPPQTTKHENIICYTPDYTIFPDSGSHYQSFKQVNLKSQIILNDLKERQIYGTKSQAILWNNLNDLNIDTSKKHIYSYNRKLKFESKEKQTINVLALIDTTIIDTLIKNKMVGEGEYLLKIKNIILSDENGKIGYQINNKERILYSSLKTIYTNDSLTLEFPFDFYAKRIYTGTNLKAYNSSGELLTVIFDKETQDKGRNISKYKIDYYGLPSDIITLILATKKGDKLKEKQISYLQLNESSKNHSNKNSYLKITHKYSSKKSENRVSCFIEDEEGNIIATAFKNRNIHTGINKINYTLTHTLETGEIATLYVRTTSGRVIAKREFIIH